MERADERMIGASWRSDPSIHGIAWPPELSTGSKIDDSEEIISQPAGDVRPKGWGPSEVSRWTTLVSLKTPEPCPDNQRESVA